MSLSSALVNNNNNMFSQQQLQQQQQQLQQLQQLQQEEEEKGVEDRFVCPLPSMKTFPEEIALCVVRDAAEGLQYLHAPPLRIAHRDVKPDNLLMTKEGRVVIGEEMNIVLLLLLL